MAAGEDDRVFRPSRATAFGGPTTLRRFAFMALLFAGGFILLKPNTAVGVGIGAFGVAVFVFKERFLRDAFIKVTSESVSTRGQLGLRSCPRQSIARVTDVAVIPNQRRFFGTPVAVGVAADLAHALDMRHLLLLDSGGTVLLNIDVTDYSDVDVDQVTSALGVPTEKAGPLTQREANVKYPEAFRSPLSRFV